MRPCWNFNLLCYFGIIVAIFRVSLGQSCTFQSGLCGWISVGAGPRWRSSRDPNTSSSSVEEPSSYAYVTISQENGTALLQSPEVTAATTDTIEISFQYQLSDHSNGDLVNALSVRWSRNGGDFDNIWLTSGPTDSWVTTSLLLAQGGVSRFAVQFMAEITVRSQDALVRIQNAEIKIKHDGCASSPCLHGGLCFGNGPTFTCICIGGYRGERCQILPGIPLSRLFRGRTSDRGVTTLNPQNVGINITSTATVKGNPGNPETSTDIPTSHGPTSLTSGHSTIFQTRGPAESSTAMATTSPTSSRAATDSSLSPCMRRTPVPIVTAATTEASVVTDVTNIGTPISDTSMASVSRLTTQSEPELSTTQTPSTLPRSTEATLSPFPSSIPELTSSGSLTLTTSTPSVNDPTTAFEELPSVTTDVVPGLSSTNEPSATRTFTSITTEAASSTMSTIQDDYYTMPDASTTSLESTESVQTTRRTIFTSIGTERTTTTAVSERSETAQVVTQSHTTEGEVGANTETASPSTHIATTAGTESTTEESPTGSGKYTDSLSTESQTSQANDLITQSFSTKEELGTYTDFTSTATNGVVTTETVTTAGVSTQTTDIQTPGFSMSTGAPDLSTVLRTTSATTANYEPATSETPTTLQSVSNTESTIYKTSSTDATESTETSIKPTMNVSTEESISDIPSTGIGVQSTSSISSSSSPSSFSSTATLRPTADVSLSTEAITFSTNVSQTTDNTPTSSTDVIASSQSISNSTSASVSGSEGGVNMPLAVGLSVTGVVCVMAACAATLIVRRARRVSYGLTQ